MIHCKRNFQRRTFIKCKHKFYTRKYMLASVTLCVGISWLSDVRWDWSVQGSDVWVSHGRSSPKPRQSLLQILLRLFNVYAVGTTETWHWRCCQHYIERSMYYTDNRRLWPVVYGCTMYCDERVYMYVCPLAYLRNHTVKLHRILCACWLAVAWRRVWHVIVYFMFCGSRRVFTNGPYGASCVSLNGERIV